MANEKRLIDANALREKLQTITADVCQEICEGFYKYGLTKPLIYLAISETPTMDAVEVVHGRWIMKETCGANTEKWHCSVCDKTPKSLCTETYCPNCGAKMDGDGNG